MHDRACNGASPGLPPSGALLPSRHGSSTYYVDEGDDEEPVKPSVMPSRQGSSTYYVDEGGESEEEPMRAPLVPKRQGSSTYYVDEGGESEEEPAGPPLVPRRQGSSTYYVDEGGESEEGGEGGEGKVGLMRPAVRAGGVLSSVSCQLLLYGEPKLVSFEADLSRDTASGLALELVSELGLDEDATTLREIERQIGVALKAGLAAQPDRATLS